MSGSQSSQPNPEHQADKAGAIDAIVEGDRELVLVKNGQRRVFRCAPGGESDLLNQIAVMADDPASDLSWFDAAVLCHQMGEQFGSHLRQMRRAS